MAEAGLLIGNAECWNKNSEGKISLYLVKKSVAGLMPRQNALVWFLW